MYATIPAKTPPPMATDNKSIAISIMSPEYYHVYINATSGLIIFKIVNKF